MPACRRGKAGQGRLGERQMLPEQVVLGHQLCHYGEPGVEPRLGHDQDDGAPDQFDQHLLLVGRHATLTDSLADHPQEFVTLVHR